MRWKWSPTGAQTVNWPNCILYTHCMCNLIKMVWWENTEKRKAAKKSNNQNDNLHNVPLKIYNWLLAFTINECNKWIKLWFPKRKLFFRSLCLFHSFFILKIFNHRFFVYDGITFRNAEIKRLKNVLNNNSVAVEYTRHAYKLNECSMIVCKRTLDARCSSRLLRRWPAFSVE